MKKLLILFLIPFVASCSKDRKAEKAIKEYLSQNMNDFKSYEPVEFGELDSMFNHQYAEMPAAEMILRDSITYQEKVDEYENVDSLEKYTILLSEAIEQLQYGRKDYKRKHIGFKQYHKFRAKNSFGGTVMHVGLFTFDPELEKVTSYTEE